MLLSKHHDCYIRTGIAVTQLNVDRFDAVAEYNLHRVVAAVSKAAFASVRTSPGDGWENVLL